VTTSLASSVLPPGALAAIAATPGVSRTVPIAAQLAVVDLRQGKQPVYLVGYDPAVGGGPWDISAGQEPQTDGEIVVDSVLASRQGLGLGDKLSVMGRRFQVVGLSQGTTSWMMSFVFVRRPALTALLSLPGAAASLAFVTPTAGTSTATLLDRLARVEGVTAQSVATMIAEDRATFARVFETVIQLMTVIAYGVGALVIGLVVYSATVEHRREFGVLKAVGARNRRLYAVVTAQSVVASLTGALAGFALAWAARTAVMRAFPQYLVAIEPRAVAVALAAGLMMALLGALLPARVVARIAPAEALRGAT
jgi:putative ABC transport system permease protein